MNEKGLKSLLCEKCSLQPYNRIHITKRDFAYAYEKDNVDFYDPNAHDFSHIKCNILNQDESEINLICKGIIVLYKRDGSIQHTRRINNKQTLYPEGNRLTHCPPVCSQ